MHEELLYVIALSNIRGLGPVKAKSLLEHLGSAKAIFREKPNSLCSIPEIGKVTAQSLCTIDYHRAEREVEFILREGIRVATWQDSHYPERLRRCDDSPIILYAKGKFDWNPLKVISIVGTRRADNYGKQFCCSLIESLKSYEPSIISGLAHGIDASAHTASVENNLPTIACVAHGLDQIYPSIHKSLATRMSDNGGIISEFISQTPIAPEMFPMRNRIIAGMSDCTIVIQTDLRGGSMITAHTAHSYGREVFAVPGRASDPLSRGCHKLIRTNVAAILTSGEDLIHYLQWDQPTKSAQSQLRFPENLDPNASAVFDVILSNPNCSFDELLIQTQLTWGILNTSLLQLEFEGLIQSLPGKRYRSKS